nr:Chain C, RBM5 PROTEIN [Mus musculus]2CLV_M Chain M, RBM5 PROTEIN [Mus musculus]2OL3_P Chain P, NATURALLY PROCESSED OCTAPEPTIDE PBM8 [synthetic construct]
SQYYYNSL